MREPVPTRAEPAAETQAASPHRLYGLSAADGADGAEYPEFHHSAKLLPSARDLLAGHRSVKGSRIEGFAGGPNGASFEESGGCDAFNGGFAISRTGPRN